MITYCHALDLDRDTADHRHVCWLPSTHQLGHVCRCFWVWGNHG